MCLIFHTQFLFSHNGKTKTYRPDQTDMCYSKGFRRFLRDNKVFRVSAQADIKRQLSYLGPFKKCQPNMGEVSFSNTVLSTGVFLLKGWRKKVVLFRSVRCFGLGWGFMTGSCLSRNIDVFIFIYSLVPHYFLTTHYIRTSAYNMYL